MSEYTNRHSEHCTVGAAVPYEGGFTITVVDGMTHQMPNEVVARLLLGTEFDLETRNFSTITGWNVDGQWLRRKTDADIDREHAEFVANMHAEHQRSLDENRESWQRREDALPDWLRVRFANFHARGGHLFERDGWGYELCIGELAVLYLESEGLDSDAVNEYARKFGTSGNQHSFAKALARAHTEAPEVSLGDSISALSPITGDAFYEGKQQQSSSSTTT